MTWLVSVAAIAASVIVFKITDAKKISEKRPVIIFGSSEIARREIGRENRHDSQRRKGNQPVQTLASFFQIAGNMHEFFIRNSFQKSNFWRSIQRVPKAFRNNLNELPRVFSRNGFVLTRPNLLKTGTSAINSVLVWRPVLCISNISVWFRSTFFGFEYPKTKENPKNTQKHNASKNLFHVTALSTGISLSVTDHQNQQGKLQ